MNAANIPGANGPRRARIRRWKSKLTTDPGDLFALDGLRPWPRPKYYEPYMDKRSAAQIVSSDHQAWKKVPLSKTAKGCRRNTTNGRRGRWAQSFKGPCGCWCCEECAIQRVVLHLGHAHSIMRAHAHIFIAVFDIDFNRSALAKQISRSEDYDWPGHPAWGICVNRPDIGKSFVYSSGELTSKAMVRGEWMDCVAAFGHLRYYGLRLPGLVRAPTYYGFAKYVDNRTSDFIATAPGLSPEQQTEYIRLREGIAERLHQTGYHDLLFKNTSAGDAVSREAWATAISTNPGAAP